MTFGSLFSGIGGMDLGLERAGMECRWQVEIDPFCNKVLEKHWPGVKRYGDIRECGEELERVDIIAGGYPCQPFSSSGKQLGTDDPRHLWPEFARLIRLLRPRIVLLENVLNHLRLGFGEVLGDLASLGYDAEWDCISAAHLGAFHHRPRVFVVGYPKSLRLGAPLFHGCPKSKVEFWERYTFSDMPNAEALRPLPHDIVYGVADGLSAGLDGIRGVGNAVVPQVAQWIGERIMACEQRNT